jgi:hypothetical protein
MPLSTQKLRVDQAGARRRRAASASGGSLRSARAGHGTGGRPRGAIPDRLAAVRSQIAQQSGAHCRKLPSRPDRGRARSGAGADRTAHSPGCSVRLRRPPFGQVTELASADSRPQADGMLIEALVRASCGGRRPLLSSESVIETSWPKHEAEATGWSSIRGWIATDPAARPTNRIVRVEPDSANQERWKTRSDIDERGHPNAIAER